jgi:hypothetical protein
LQHALGHRGILEADIAARMRGAGSI